MLLPEVLYKYRTVDGHTSELLTQRRAYLPSLGELNDPFEGRVVLAKLVRGRPYWPLFQHTLRRVYGELRERELAETWIRHVASTAAEPWPEDLIRRTVYQLLTDPEGFLARWDPKQGHDNTMRIRRQDARVFCMSATALSIPMWSYYADGHKGICIGFRPSEDPFLCEAQPVGYREDYPDVHDHEVDDDEYFRLTVLTKSQDWSHEKEWRVVRWKDRLSMTELKPACFQTVIFGCEVTPERRSEVMEWARAGGLGVSFQIARPAERRFALELAPCT
jgi:hypothetical protein